MPLAPTFTGNVRGYNIYKPNGIAPFVTDPYHLIARITLLQPPGPHSTCQIARLESRLLFFGAKSQLWKKNRVHKKWGL